MFSHGSASNNQSLGRTSKQRQKTTLSLSPRLKFAKNQETNDRSRWESLLPFFLGLEGTQFEFHQSIFTQCARTDSGATVRVSHGTGPLPVPFTARASMGHSVDTRLILGTHMYTHGHLAESINIS